MPLCWPRAQPGLLPSPVTTPAAPVAVARTPPPETPGRFRRAVSLLLVQGASASRGVMSGRYSRPPDGPAAGGSSLLDAGARRASRVRRSADVQFVRVVLGELHVRRHIGHAERLERGEELLGGPPAHMGLGLPHGHHVQPVLVRAGRPGEQAVDVLGRVVLGGDRGEAVDRYPGRRGDVDVCHVCPAFSWVCAGRKDATGKPGSGHPWNHSMEYSFTVGPGTHGRLASCSPQAQAAIWLRLRSPSLVRMCWTWFSA